MMRTAMCVVVLILVAATVVAAAPAEKPITADQLIYPGATVDTRLDVNGAAAVSLVGGAVDSMVAQAQQAAEQAAQQAAKDAEQAARDAERAAQQATQQAPADAQRAAAEAQRAAAEAAKAAVAAQEQARQAQLQAMEAAGQAAKSLQDVKLIIQRPKKPVKPADFMKHYQGLLAPRGWSQLFTLQDEDDGSAVLIMLAPGGKGIFLGVSDREDIVTGLVTTGIPLNDLIAKLMRGGSLSTDMMGNLFGGMLRGHQRAGPKAEQGQPEEPDEPADQD